MENLEFPSAKTARIGHFKNNMQYKRIVLLQNSFLVHVQTRSTFLILGKSRFPTKKIHIKTDYFLTAAVKSGKGLVRHAPTGTPLYGFIRVPLMRRSC